VTVESTANAGPRIRELDALRGLAALAVVLFHYTTRYTEVYGQR
jgi:peptidoglycan/LPS O-acetylase OafA/YrhL